MESGENFTYLKLNRPLDYETIPEHTVTVSVVNSYGRTATTVIKIEVLDVNDNIPYFRDFNKNGTVRENEPAGVPIMQVRAFDDDATSAHNQVNINGS